jgi:serpin B
VKSRTRLVLTNAIYFNGEWVHPFAEHAMLKAPFHAAAGDKPDTQFMTQVKHLRYASHNGVQALELPYRDTSYSLVVLLPEKVDGLKQLESSLNARALDELTAKLETQLVGVQLPSFKSRLQLDLAETLSAMGMPLPFSSSADFSGISTEEEMNISAVFHEAYVDVNKKGTEAAAATAAIVYGAPSPVNREEPIIFRADHPFIYLIRDSKSGNLLFVGRLTDPQS